MSCGWLFHEEFGNGAIKFCPGYNRSTKEQ